MYIGEFGDKLVRRLSAKSWCFQTVVLEKILEIPFDSKDIKPVNPKGNNPEYSLKGLMLQLQYVGHVMWSRLTGKDRDTGKDWRQKGANREWDG